MSGMQRNVASVAAEHSATITWYSAVLLMH